MPENSEPTSENRRAAFSRKIAAMEARKLKAKRQGVQGIWLGLGMFGLIGWAVTIPTLLGAMLGIYIDGHYPGSPFWPLSLLIVGLFIGCSSACHCSPKEENSIREVDERKKDE